MKTNSERYETQIDAVRRILIESAEDSPDHLAAEELSRYVDGAVDRADAELVESHLDECRSCRDDADDLRTVRRLLNRNRALRWIAAAIVVPATAAAMMWFASARNQPTLIAARSAAGNPIKRRYENSDWQQLVSVAIDQHRLPSSAITGSLRGPQGFLRGESAHVSADLYPTGIAIDTVNPHFKWPGTPKAIYRITIAAGDEVIASAGPLFESEWQCDRPLARDRTYTWQVDVRSTEEDSLILPTVDQPPAMFRIISDIEHRDIARAAAARPGDHLLLAALFARSGMDAEAKEEVRRLATQEPRDLDVQRLVSNTLGQRP